MEKLLGYLSQSDHRLLRLQNNILDIVLIQFEVWRNLTSTRSSFIYMENLDNIWAHFSQTSKPAESYRFCLNLSSILTKSKRSAGPVCHHLTKVL